MATSEHLQAQPSDNLCRSTSAAASVASASGSPHHGSLPGAVRPEQLQGRGAGRGTSKRGGASSATSGTGVHEPQGEGQQKEDPRMRAGERLYDAALQSLQRQRSVAQQSVQV